MNRIIILLCLMLCTVTVSAQDPNPKTVDQNVPGGTGGKTDNNQNSSKLLQTTTTNPSTTSQVSASLPKDHPVIQNLINNMIFVEGGIFTMGTNKEQDSISYEREWPAHQVQLPNYKIGRYEVTQEEWEHVMKNNPSYKKGKNLPVEQVSWDDCQEFIRRLNRITGMKFRLPTEAEWEYAARGGQKSRVYKYAGSNKLGSVAWYSENSDYDTHAVGSKGFNELGLYDMSGNVWEWCQDWYDVYYYNSSPVKSPRNDTETTRRVFRGGGIYDDAKSCRCTQRGYYDPDHVDAALGFRLALSE